MDHNKPSLVYLPLQSQTDVCMSGPVLNPVASPTLMDLYLPAVRDIASPENEDESYYEWWRRWAGQEEDWRPAVEPFVGAGSDHASFLFYAGLPVMDIMFEEDSKAPAISMFGTLRFVFASISLCRHDDRAVSGTPTCPATPPTTRGSRRLSWWTGSTTRSSGCSPPVPSSTSGWGCSWRRARSCHFARKTTLTLWRRGLQVQSSILS